MKGICITGLIFFTVLFALGFFFRSDNLPNLSNRLQSPNLVHFLGTDQLGRDICTRGLDAMSRTVAIAVTAWGMALAIGIAIGVIGALFENRFIGWVIDGAIGLAYTTPLLLLLVGVLSTLGRGIAISYLIVVLVAWAPIARHTRSIVRETLSARFVIASREMGFSSGDVTRFILLPFAYRPVLIASLPVLPELIAIDAALTFFGFGPSPPTPTVGGMIIDGLHHYGQSAWLLTWPVMLLAANCLLVRFVVQSMDFTAP